MMRFHPSSVGLLMTDAKSIDLSIVPAHLHEICTKARKTDADRELLAPYQEMSLSAGAKTYLKGLAKEYIYGVRKIIDTKYMDKGKALEDRAIEFVSHRHFKRYVKNTERRKNEWLTGEADIYVPGVKTIDTKVSWSLDTFPMLPEDAHDPLYEWQGRSYMLLWDVPEHEVVHVLLDTPEDLLPRWEQEDLHRVEHIDPDYRITSVTYKRCPILEAKLIRKCQAAQAYLERIVAEIRAHHGAPMEEVEAPKAAPVVSDWRKQFVSQ